MTQRFRDKVVVVIGGNSGIGMASAKAFAEEGAQVVITGRTADGLEEAARRVGHHAVPHRCDISAVPQIIAVFKALRERFGRVDVLFVNAGVLALQPIESVSEADWDWVQSTNVKGAFFSVQQALPLMAKGSAIVLNSSTAAHRGVSNAVAYSASKAGLSGLGRSLAAELVGRGIRVNNLSPGPTDTPIFRQIRGLTVETEADIRRQQIACVPMRRMGTPDEIAAAVLFLASDSASFITGIDLFVDGGIIGL